MKSGGGCGGERYCVGAMVDVVIGAVAVQGGRVVTAVADGLRWLNMEDRRGPTRNVGARMKRVPAKMTATRKIRRSRGNGASLKDWAQMVYVEKVMQIAAVVRRSY